MTNIKFLLLGGSLSFIPTLSLAQCVATQDCATLGYTETSCNGGKGVKCPFGNKWFCFETEEEFKTRLCPELGFTLDCSGKNQTGSNYTCNGKYNYCNCAEGYSWKNGKCEKTEQMQNGAVEDLYYCNGTVVGVRAPNMNYYIAMQDLGLMTWSSGNTACLSYSFCGNLKGTLPTKDQLVTMSKSSLNSLLSTNGGTELKKLSYWSSTSDYSNGYHYNVNMSNGIANSSWRDNSNKYVRCVLTSW